MATVYSKRFGKGGKSKEVSMKPIMSRNEHHENNKHKKLLKMVQEAIKEREEWEQFANLCMEFVEGKHWSVTDKGRDKQKTNLIRTIVNDIRSKVYVTDPEIYVETENADNWKYARYLQTFINSLWKRLKVNRKFKQAIRDAIITGMGYVKEIMVDRKNVVEYVPWGRIYLDPGVDRPEDSGYMVEELMMSLETIKANYKVKGIDKKLGDSKQKDKKKKDIKVWELWVKDDAKYYLLTDKWILKESDNPFYLKTEEDETGKKIESEIWNPYSIIRVDCFKGVYGIGRVRDLIGVQRRLNKNLTARQDHLNTFKEKTVVNARLVAKGSAQFKKLSSNNIAEIIEVHGDPTKAVAVMGGAQVNPALFADEQSAVDQLFRIAEIPSRNYESLNASQIQALQVDDERKLSVIADSITDALQDAAETMLYLVWRDWTDEMVARVNFSDERYLPEAEYILQKEENIAWFKFPAAFFNADYNYSVYINTKDLSGKRKVVESQMALQFYQTAMKDENFDKRKMAAFLCRVFDEEPEELLKQGGVMPAPIMATAQSGSPGGMPAELPGVSSSLANGQEPTEQQIEGNMAGEITNVNNLSLQKGE